MGEAVRAWVWLELGGPPLCLLNLKAVGVGAVLSLWGSRLLLLKEWIPVATVWIYSSKGKSTAGEKVTWTYRGSVFICKLLGAEPQASIVPTCFLIKFSSFLSLSRVDQEAHDFLNNLRNNGDIGLPASLAIWEVAFIWKINRWHLIFTQNCWTSYSLPRIHIYFTNMTS